MSERVDFQIIRVDFRNNKLINFMRKNLRDFYTHEILAWQYECGQEVGGLFVTMHKEEFVASQGMIPVYLSINNSRVLTTKSESTYLISEFRGLGIFEDLYAHCVNTVESNGVELIWGFTALSKVWKKKLKFEVFDNIIYEAGLQINFKREISYIIDTNMSIKDKCKSLAKALYSQINEKTPKHYDSNFQIKILNFNKKTDQCEIIETYSKWKKNNPHFICLDTNLDFLKWRIVENPKIEYLFIGIYKNDKIEAIAIINITGIKAYLVDFIVIKTNNLTDCFNALIVYAKRHLKNSHLIFWGNSHNKYYFAIFQQFIHAHSFYYQNKAMNFVLKKSEKSNLNSLEIYDISRYCLNGLWTEGFFI